VLDFYEQGYYAARSLYFYEQPSSLNTSLHRSWCWFSISLVLIECGSLLLKIDFYMLPISLHIMVLGIDFYLHTSSPISCASVVAGH
jgi:hypothetical protein